MFCVLRLRESNFGSKGDLQMRLCTAIDGRFPVFWGLYFLPAHANFMSWGNNTLIDLKVFCDPRALIPGRPIT